MKPSVAVVILNWNGRHLLERFLASVVATSYEGVKIYVADNASTDHSVAFVKTTYPEIEVIVFEQNHGFAGGYNLALSQITADYYVLLNSDVEVEADWISPVIQQMQADPLIAVAQPKIRWERKKSHFEYAGAAGGFVDQQVFPFCRGRIFDEVEEDLGQYDQSMELFWASGAAFFIKSSAWAEAGGLDADLFAHMEEIDLCWRLQNLGYRIVYCPDAVVYHVGGATLQAGNPHKTYLNFRNNLIMMQKNLPKDQLFGFIFVRLWLDLMAWFQFLLKGKPAFTWAISKAHFDFFKYYRQTARKRSTHQLPFNRLQGVYPKSIVWDYFFRRIKKFSDLKWNQSS